MAKPIRRRTTSSPDIDLPAQADQGQRNVIILAAIAVGVIALAAMLYFSLRDPEPIEGIVDMGRPARGHDDNVTYPQNNLPPAGGVHANIWQNCGIYNEPIASKNAVHSLEHGAVWIAYQPELPADQIERLKDAVRGKQFLLLAPFPGLESPIILSSWGYQLAVEDAEDNRIEQFIDQNVQGIRTPERGASCADGVGTPDET